MLSNKIIYTLLVGAITSMLLISATIAGPLMAAPTKQQLKANLKGEKEIPPVTTTAKGGAKFKVKETKITYKINITGISDPTGAHIHLGKTNENGEIVTDLLKIGTSKKTPVGVVITGTITDPNLVGPLQGKTFSDLASSMNTGDTYVNVHTEKYPDGEIRGQIKISGSNITASTSNDVAETIMTESD